MYVRLGCSIYWIQMKCQCVSYGLDIKYMWNVSVYHMVRYWIQVKCECVSYGWDIEYRWNVSVCHMGEILNTGEMLVYISSMLNIMVCWWFREDCPDLTNVHIFWLINYVCFKFLMHIYWSALKYVVRCILILFITEL